jgi:hypothetical protein
VLIRRRQIILHAPIIERQAIVTDEHLPCQQVAILADIVDETPQ